MNPALSPASARERAGTERGGQGAGGPGQCAEGSPGTQHSLTWFSYTPSQARLSSPNLFSAARYLQLGEKDCNLRASLQKGCGKPMHSRRHGHAARLRAAGTALRAGLAQHHGAGARAPRGSAELGPAAGAGGVWQRGAMGSQLSAWENEAETARRFCSYPRSLTKRGQVSFESPPGGCVPSLVTHLAAAASAHLQFCWGDRDPAPATPSPASSEP